MSKKTARNHNRNSTTKTPQPVGNFSLRLTTQVWNAPTWFLSALSFALCALPYCLRVLATQKKEELRQLTLFWLFFFLIFFGEGRIHEWVFPKIGVLYPQIIHFNRVFHYKPSILGAHPYFWKNPNGGYVMNLRGIFFRKTTRGRLEADAGDPDPSELGSEGWT